MNRYIMKCPHCGYECETGEMLPLEIMELNDMLIDCGNCGKEMKITKETFTPCSQQQTLQQPILRYLNTNLM